MRPARRQAEAPQPAGTPKNKLSLIFGMATVERYSRREFECHI